MIYLKRLIPVFVVIGGILASIFLANPPTAKSDMLGTSRVTVFWTGSACIDILGIYGENYVKCGGYAQFINTSTYVGTSTGVDPIMGTADTLSCNFYLNGSLVYTDFAIAGDGTDVNCLREITGSNVVDGSYI